MPKHPRRKIADGSLQKSISIPPEFWNRMLPYVNSERDGNLSLFIRDLVRDYLKKKEAEVSGK